MAKNYRLTKEDQQAIRKYHQEFDVFLKRLQLDHLTKDTRKEGKDA